MSRKTVKTLFVIVLVISLAVIAGVALYFQSEGFHYPCVRCNPWGNLWQTPTPPPFYKLIF